MDYLTAFPASFESGATLNVKFPVSETSPVDWAATLAIVGPKNEVAVSGALNATSDEWLFTIAATDTDDFIPGHVKWRVRVSRTDPAEVKTIASGSSNLLPDIMAGGAFVDTRTFALRQLEKVEAFLNGDAQAGVASYEIAGRKLSKHSPEELYNIRDRLKAEAARDVRKENGKKMPQVRVAFS